MDAFVVKSFLNLRISANVSICSRQDTQHDWPNAKTIFAQAPNDGADPINKKRFFTQSSAEAQGSQRKYERSQMRLALALARGRHRALGGRRREPPSQRASSPKSSEIRRS
jgi:hypothetical protein